MIETPAPRPVLCGLFAAVALCAWTAVSAADDSGERLYDQHCAKCHGPEGRGRGTVAPSLVPFNRSYEEALELIRRPVCDMPPIPESILSDAQVAQIVDYLKTIK